jgi:hypothetical protein
MTRKLPAVALFLLLAACGDKPAGPAAPATPAAPAASPTEEGAVGARAAVEAYMVAAKKPDEAAMLALGTAEFQAKEKTWKKGFTLNLVKKVIALKTYEIRDPEVEKDAATVSVRAVFLAEGKDNGEGMRFSLVRRDGRWWIAELR